MTACSTPSTIDEIKESFPKHTFLVRILDLESKPTYMTIVRSPEEGKELFESLKNANFFIDTDDIFEISQGATILESYEIVRESDEI